MDRPPAQERHQPEQDWWWIFDPRLSLRARAALIFGGSAVAFTLLLGSLAGSIFRQSLERQAGANFETLAFQISDKLDRVIYERYQALQLAAGLAPFRAAGFGPADRRRVLETLQGGTREFAWIGFADASGQITAATRGHFEGSRVEMRPWFRAGRERPYAGDLAENPALVRALTRSDQPQATRFLDLSVPVYAETGQFLGVLGAHLQWDWAKDVQLSVIPESARRELLGATVYSASGDVLLDSGASGWTLPPEPPVISDSRRFRGFLIENTSGGTKYVTGFVRSRGVREYRGLGWFITVRQPLERAFAPALELHRSIVVWGLLFSGALLVVSWLAAARLARRFRGIGVAADRIRGGDPLTVMPRPRGEGELARMCGALGDMVDELRQLPAAAPAPNRPAALPPPAAEKSSARAD